MDTRCILKKGWKGLGDILDVEMDDIYPSRTLCLLSLYRTPLFVLVKFGEWQQKSDAVGEAGRPGWGLKVLCSLCSETVAPVVPSKAIVSLICPGTGAGSREFSDR